MSALNNTRSTAGGGETRQQQQTQDPTELAKQIQLLEVCDAELRTLKTSRAVYEKRGSLLFLTSKADAMTHVQEKLAQLKVQRDSALE